MTKVMKVYTVYYLEEQKNELGNPYIGQTYRLRTRANQHKFRLKLNHTPILHPIQTFNTAKEARAFEKIKKIETGWPPENHIQGKIGGGVKGKNKGKVWINNGIENERVYYESLEEYYNKGYIDGRIYFKRNDKGYTWLNNGIENKKAMPEKLSELFLQGWTKGRLKK